MNIHYRLFKERLQKATACHLALERRKFKSCDEFKALHSFLYIYFGFKRTVFILAWRHFSFSSYDGALIIAHPPTTVVIKKHMVAVYEINWQQLQARELNFFQARGIVYWCVYARICMHIHNEWEEDKISELNFNLIISPLSSFHWLLVDEKYSSSKPQRDVNFNAFGMRCLLKWKFNGFNLWTEYPSKELIMATESRAVTLLLFRVFLRDLGYSNLCF